MQRFSILGLILATTCLAGAVLAQQQPMPAQPMQPAQPQPQPRQAQPAPAQPMPGQPMQPQPQAVKPGAPVQGPQSPNGPAAQAREDIKTTFGFVPRFLSDMPDRALPGAWQDMKALQMSANTALPPKLKELIGLAVAAQVPCHYCTYAHTEFAKLHGASVAETKEAVIVAAEVRRFSTIAQGTQQDIALFRREVQTAITNMKQVGSGQRPAPQPLQITDANSALQDVQQHFGMVPEFIRRIPPESLPGAWREMRDVIMSQDTAISGKHKTLIGIAVASQIPCRYCLAADTEFAKQLDGSTDREINEAIAMAALTRHWSTWLNGSQIDEAQFKRDIDRVVRTAQKQMPTAQRPTAGPALAAAVQPAKPAAQPEKKPPAASGAAAKQ